VTRRHNRHFCLDDNLTQCGGTSGAGTKWAQRCHNWGKPDARGLYACHTHRGQEARHHKRLSRAELLVEWHRTAFVAGIHGPFIWGARNAVVQRMLDLPHAADNDYQ